MGIDRTKLKANLLDRQRNRAGYSNLLQLVRYSLSSGYSTIKTVTKGWCPFRTTDQGQGVIGEHFFDIEIAQTDTTSPTLTTVFAEKLTHVTLEGLRYEIVGGITPLGTKLLWRIRCSPRGVADA